MGQPIEITRHEFSASDLRRVAAKTGEGGWVRRLLAIALLLDGHSREAAASANGMTRQTLRDWVHRFNADGVSGLRSRTSPGRPPALTETRWEELKIIGTRRTRSRAAPCGALAAYRPLRRDRRAMVGQGVRADHGQMAAPAWHDPAAAATLPPEEGPGGRGGF